MANQSSEDRSFCKDPSQFSGVLTFLTSGLVVAILYFARDIIVPITLAVLLSFLLSPVVRALRRLQIGRIGAVSITAVVSFLIILGFVAVVVRNTEATSKPKFVRFRTSCPARESSAGRRICCKTSALN